MPYVDGMGRPRIESHGNSTFLCGLLHCSACAEVRALDGAFTSLAMPVLGCAGIAGRR